MAQAEPLVCRDGFRETQAIRAARLEDVIVLGDSAWAVGTESDADTTRRPLVMRHLADGWQGMPVPVLSDDDGLTAIAGRARGNVWAVGFTGREGTSRPYAMHWNGKRWTLDRPRMRGSAGSGFTDVTMDDDGRTWAVGFRGRSRGGNRPLVVRRVSRSWVRMDPSAVGSRSMTLRAVGRTPSGGLWAVGYWVRRSRVEPLVMRHREGRWKRMPLPPIEGEAALADVIAVSGSEAWAVGYQRTAEATLPLVLRWDGSRWDRAPAPDSGGDPALLLALSAPSSGGVWAVGSRWDPGANAYRSLAAWWDGRTWVAVPSADGGKELHGVAGAPDLDGWVAGRSQRGGLLSRVCLEPSAGLFGGHDPDEEAVTDDASPPTKETGSERASALTVASPSGRSAKIRAARAGQAARTGQARRSGSARSPRVRPLPKAGPHPDVVARDMTRAAGIAGRQLTYGGVVADFNADGLDDLFIGGHSLPGRLWLNRGGRFEEHTALQMPRVDRHGCAVADVDGSGLPDLVCTVGASRGSGLKANELWIDPGGPEPREAAGPAGLFDPTGRGRLVTLLRVDDDEHPDVIIANAPSRVDGLPSPSRLFMGAPEARFAARSRTGFDALIGARSLQAADLDGDGRDELLLVAHDDQYPGMTGIRIYLNTGKGLVDATARLGVRRMAERDAHFVDLDGDGRQDLVQLSGRRLRVSLWRDGRFRRVYERGVTEGVALASGDVNGDGFNDLYILRGSWTRNAPDKVLVNTSRGRRFRSVMVPQVTSARPESVLAIDHDANGLTDFVVLHGRGGPGPVHLVAFFPRESEARSR